MMRLASVTGAGKDEDDKVTPKSHGEIAVKS